jgi:hypothetical protein
LGIHIKTKLLVTFEDELKLHESIENVTLDAVSVLNAPAAVFGRLSSLTNRSKAYVHPQMLLRSIAHRNITVLGTVSGKDKDGERVVWPLKPLVLKPQVAVHIDLDEQRKESGSKLADGVAGVRLIHDGAPTDVVAELINIDDRGGFAFYDAVRNSLYNVTSQAAISFDLAGRNQSFLILKNTADSPQQATVRLDYEEGQSSYEPDLPPIAPQQVEVIDIRQLRDAHIPDKYGQELPATVEFGGAAGPPQSHVHVFRMRSLGGQRDSFDGVFQRQNDATCNFRVEGCD